MLHRRSFLFLLKERLIFGFLAEKQARKNKSREKSEQRGQRNRSVSEENARQIKSRRGNERKRTRSSRSLGKMPAWAEIVFFAADDVLFFINFL